MPSPYSFRTFYLGQQYNVQYCTLYSVQHCTHTCTFSCWSRNYSPLVLNSCMVFHLYCFVLTKEYVHLEGKWEVTTLLPSQIEPNWPLPSVACQHHCKGMLGRQAGSPIAVYAQVQCREPKTGQQKVHFYCEDD